MFVVNCHEVTGGTEEWTFIAAMCGKFDFAAMCGEFDFAAMCGEFDFAVMCGEW